MKTIQIRWTRYVGHCWRSKDEFLSDVLLWTPSHGRAKVWQPARTYIQQFCANTRCSLEDLPGAMDDRDGLRERVREIHTSSMTSWWWWTHTHTIKIKVDKPILTMDSAMTFRSLKWNIIAESVVSVGLSTFPFIFIILSNLPKATISPYIKFKYYFSINRKKTSNFNNKTFFFHLQLPQHRISINK